MVPVTTTSLSKVSDLERKIRTGSENSLTDTVVSLKPTAEILRITSPSGNTLKENLPLKSVEVPVPDPEMTTEAKGTGSAPQFTVPLNVCATLPAGTTSRMIHI
jgi:hypothetical protein